MRLRPAITAVGLVMLCACASDSTGYQVTDRGAVQVRSDAEKTHAALINQGLAGPRDLDAPLKVIQSPFPEYPPGLRNDNFVGSVRIRFFVERDGTVGDPSVVGSPPAALAALCL